MGDWCLPLHETPDHLWCHCDAAEPRHLHGTFLFRDGHIGDLYLDRHDTTKIPSGTPTLPSKPSQPADTTDPPSVGTVEHMRPQSDEQNEGGGEGGTPRYAAGGPVPRAGRYWLLPGEEIRPARPRPEPAEENDEGEG